MGNVKIVLNRAAVRNLLRSEPVRKDLEKRADRIAAAAGLGFESDSRVGQNRARAEVRAATLNAKGAEARERRLTKALDAGR